MRGPRGEQKMNGTEPRQKLNGKQMDIQLPDPTTSPSLPKAGIPASADQMADKPAPARAGSSQRLTAKSRKIIEVDPELARSSDSEHGFETESSPSICEAASADPEALYPHLHVLLKMRKMAFAEAYTREETRRILGICEKTLQRWIDQKQLETYGLPDVCASAADIEKCLLNRRCRSKKHY